MSSPPPSSFVPLTLTDTLKAQRTLPRSSSARGAGARPSHAHNQSQSTRDARRMMLALGLAEEPDSPAEEDEQARSGDGSTLETPRPKLPSRTTSASSSTSGTDQQELAALRRQVASLQKGNRDLEARADRAEREKAKALASQSSSGGSSFDARQIAELERSFADQERLLLGYQQQSEKEQAEREVLQRKLRKYGEVLARTFGDDFEQTLLESPFPTIAASAAAASAFSSPALRGKLIGRQSLAGTPLGQLPLRRRPSDRHQDTLAEEESLEGDSAVEGAEGTANGQAGSLLQPEALSAHLDAVQTLLRSMEKRIIDREMELAAMEKRSREDAQRARVMGEELEELVRKLREERV